MIDPGQAFGTGAHATTRLCLELLLELAASQPGQRQLLDVGTGSGVLAIAAAHWATAPVSGLDHDRESVQAAAENASVNGVSIEVRRFDLRVEPLPAVKRRSGTADRGSGQPAASAAARLGERDAHPRRAPARRRPAERAR